MNKLFWVVTFAMSYSMYAQAATVLFNTHGTTQAYGIQSEQTYTWGSGTPLSYDFSKSELVYVKKALEKSGYKVTYNQEVQADAIISFDQSYYYFPERGKFDPAITIIANCGGDQIVTLSTDELISKLSFLGCKP